MPNDSIVRPLYTLAALGASTSGPQQVAGTCPGQHTPGKSSIAGDNVGREAVFAQFGRYVGDTAGTFKATLGAVFESQDGRVVGLHHNSAERNGKQRDTGCCISFVVEGGQIMSGREHFFDLYNWDEFWS